MTDKVAAMNEAIAFMFEKAKPTYAEGEEVVAKLLAGLFITSDFPDGHVHRMERFDALVAAIRAEIEEQTT